MSAPLSNPPFVFPARDPNDANTQDLPVEPQSRPRPPLPAFSFNPGSEQTSQPSIPTPQKNRPGGHRRQYSEFVGGDELVGPESTDASHHSDEKTAPTPANLSAPGPGFSAGGRRKRSHAHRRSGAVSSVDLSAISKEIGLKPSPDSAPTTPADMKRDHRSDAMRPLSHSATSLNRATPPTSPLMGVTANFPARKFSETDNLPLSADQPLSATASEAPGVPSSNTTEDTARNSGSPPARNTNLEASPKHRARPKTADASFTFEQDETPVQGDATPRKRPISAAHHSRAHKSLSSGVLELALRKMKHGGDDVNTNDWDDEASDPSVDGHHDSTESSPPAKEKEKSKEKRQKKVRSWAEAILTRRKGKLHQSKKDRAGDEHSKLPPVITRTNSDMGSNLDVDFDDDNIVVIRTPTNPNAPESTESTPDTPTTPTLENSWKPRSFYEQGKEVDARSPIIDLDAALGPFNTPETRPGFVAGSNFSAATKRMYSGGRRGEFVGPEMRYHRRAESAPEMPPFDRSFMSGNRFGSGSAIESADVFYEEEEDAFLATGGKSPDTTRASSPPPRNPNTDSNDGRSTSSKESAHTLTRSTAEVDENPPNAGLGIRRNAPSEVPMSNLPCSSQSDPKAFKKQNAVEQLQQAKNPFSQPRSPVEIVKQEDWQQKTQAPASPDISPRFLPADKRPSTSPIDFGSTIPRFSLHDGPSLPNSSYPSPDFNGTTDPPRTITTPSTSDRKSSGPPYNIPLDQPYGSIEDVPSLTSSASTMTSRMHRLSATFLPRTRFSADRSASFSATAGRRTSQANSTKRSSFASLSKLVPGPHAERSKLCHEEKPPGDAPEKSKKKGGHRISRLKSLWRTKDKNKSSEDVSHR
ncbi:hypothetical protein PHISCL_08854 [Aspergillus sclerotialis]|uniref:Cell wall proline rich protein n=1 Tax=Aspergillus sclerotialis TaxID=2070753 RepID=A0A3A2Z856_9EURO|nr:hypothetical protein PHISCL_08854 [Aspergillus sclerotialis]